MLKIVRTGESFKVKHNGTLYEGRRCEVIEGKIRLEGIYRSGFSLPPGVYECEMRPKPEDPTARPAIRFVRQTEGDPLSKKQERDLAKGLFLCGAHFPWQLESCIGIGIVRDHDGVRGGGDAVKIMMSSLGGFELGASLTVRIEDSPKKKKEEPKEETEE